jgi:hypothetical protein
MRISPRTVYLLQRAIFRVSPRFAQALNFEFPLIAPNRTFLEKQIFGLINTRTSLEGAERCLFIGLDKHNWHYHRLLNCDFYSIDIKEKNAVYGQPGKHTVGCALTLAERYPVGFFSTVIANGLIGFGMSAESDFDKMMRAIHVVLQPNGLLILGYNNRPDLLSFDVVASQGYQLFEPMVPPISGVTTSMYAVKDKFMHTYLFLKKNSDEPS